MGEGIEKKEVREERRETERFLLPLTCLYNGNTLLMKLASAVSQLPFTPPCTQMLYRCSIDLLTWSGGTGCSCQDCSLAVLSGEVDVGGQYRGSVRCISLSCSVKWVGVFVVTLVGLTTIKDLWDLLGNLKLSMVRKHLHPYIIAFEHDDHYPHQRSVTFLCDDHYPHSSILVAPLMMCTRVPSVLPPEALSCKVPVSDTHSHPPLRDCFLVPLPGA